MHSNRTPKSSRDEQDLARRKAVCTSEQAQVVLFKFSGEDLGLPRVNRGPAKENHLFSKATTENIANGTQPQSYRRSTRGLVDDSGYLAVEAAHNVEFSSLLKQLEQRSYVFTGAHSFTKRDGSVVNVAEFTLRGRATKMPERLREVLMEDCFDAVYVYCNPKNIGDREKPDTINAAISEKARPTRPRSLRMTSDNCYLVH